MVPNGHCAELATLVWEGLCPNVPMAFDSTFGLQWRDCDAPCHTWLYFDGRHYDMLDSEGASSQAAMKEFARMTVADLRLIARGKEIKIKRGWKKLDLQRALGWL